ncbi:enoyl-CoA hydratase/isomerase family protein [Psychrobacillus sp. BL-248-WT-3]|uniref:enoyl-CoA hydratase-related protein n=1 Tax=Psychrobacillus sp. BL-248-WT-3 TaxID=2725306 RepID=UPI00146CD29A|nr:enoyl-CoA hydratase/isomerase family protein [Psychrobacillus sp. BL-248-WT-3]
MDSKVIYKVEDNIARIILNRPTALNALDNDMIADLISCLNETKKDDNVRVIIIEGTGKTFCAGDDLVDMGTDKNPNPTDKLTEYSDGYPAVVLAMKNLEKPIIVKAHKYALGAGCEIALAADFIIASNETKFGLPFVLRGISAGTYLLQKRIGYHRAARYLFLGEMFGTKEANDWGLLYKHVELERLDEEVWDLASHLAKSATRAIGLMKKAMHNSESLTVESAFQVQTYSTLASYHTADYAEGKQAFIEKRNSIFKGR